MTQKHPIVKALPWWAAIYLPAWGSFFLLNWVFTVFPISFAPWFDNVCVQLLACWWAFVWATTGLWPFTKIQGRFARGIAALISCWILGFLTWYIYIKVFNMDASTRGFPLIANLFFFVAVTSFVGENAHVRELSVPKQFAINMVIWFTFTWLLLSSAIVWIPAWWFGIGQTFLAIGFLDFFKDLRQPIKSIAAWSIIGVKVMITAIICLALGYWQPGTQFGEFWTIGNPGLVFFVFFAAWCSYNWGILVPMGLWPFTGIKHPVWRYIVAVLFVCFLAWLVTLFALAVFPKFYDPRETALWQAFTWAYIPTAWTFFICLLFPAEQR